MAEEPTAARTRPLVLDCLSCPTRRLAEWSVIDDEEMGIVNEAKATRRYAKGTQVHAQGQPCTGLFCIADGTVGVRRNESWLRAMPPVMVRLVFAGQTLGYRDFVHGGPCSTGAKALQPSVICSVDGAALRRLLRRNRRLAALFQSHLAEELESTEAALAQVAWLPVRSRLARLMLELAERTGAHAESGRLELALPMSRRDMAELLCMRPETLTRTLQAMQVDGLLLSEGHHISIPDVDRLQREAVANPAA